MIRILPFGAFRHRQPLAYDPVARRLDGRVLLVDRPQEAQIVVISHHLDLENSGSELLAILAAHPGLRLVLLSEEPFWDTVWAPDPFSREQRFETADGFLRYRVLNHHTSDIYRARAIPYFLLTDPGYIARYRPLFDRNAGISVAGWLAYFRGAELDAAFMGERRVQDQDRRGWPDRDVWGLSHYRTRFTLLCRKGRVLRAGKGWVAGPRRQDLGNWHADKLALLDMRCRHVAAFENTHQADYVSEKIYDAFAVGAVPLYFAGPGHAAHRLVGERGWLNFYAPPPQASPFDARRAVSLAEAEAYAATQARLAAVFAEPATVEAELDRLADALMVEFHLLAEDGAKDGGKRPIRSGQIAKVRRWFSLPS